MEMMRSNSGPRAIDLYLERHKSGIKVELKVLPEIEEFFKYWGGGMPEGLSHGRLWHTLGTDPTIPLQVWTFQHPLTHLDNKADYTIYPTGAGFWVEDRLNISFLRLIGASTGCSFLWDAVMSRTELDKLSNKLLRAAESFYIEYIQKVRVNIFVGIEAAVVSQDKLV